MHVNLSSVPQHLDKVLGDTRTEKLLVMLEAFTVGLLVAIGVSVVVPLFFGVYFLYFVFIYLETVPLLTIIGALVGKLFTKDHWGTLVGAALVVCQS
jgi:hypothetical protein